MVTVPKVERRRRYNPVTPTVSFPVLDADGNALALFDLADVEAWVDGVRQSTDDYTVEGDYVDNSITNAVVVADSPGWTGTVDIVCSRSPNRTDQFAQGQPVPARDLNLALNRLSAETRDLFDAMQRAVKTHPGVIGPALIMGLTGELLMFDEDLNIVGGPRVGDLEYNASLLQQAIDAVAAVLDLFNLFDETGDLGLTDLIALYEYGWNGGIDPPPEVGNYLIQVYEEQALWA